MVVVRRSPRPPAITPTPSPLNHPLEAHVTYHTASYPYHHPMQVTKPVRAATHPGMAKRAAQNHMNHHCPEQNITPAHTSSLNSQVTSPSSTMSRKPSKKPSAAKYVYVTPPAPQHCTQVRHCTPVVIRREGKGKG